MPPLLLSLGIATAVVAFVWVVRSRSPPPSTQVHPPTPPESIIGKTLGAALPESVLLDHTAPAFTRSVHSYWAQQEREVVHACIVQPRNTDELALAITVLNQEYIKQKSKANKDKDHGDVVFAVRGGGQSPVRGGASAPGGVLIDLALLREVTVSPDRESVTIGAGARWKDVSRVLDGMGLAVVGGRSSEVGVAGYTLGGGISFFTPRYGLACSNVLAYEVVLASGQAVTATATSYTDLWRALQGGSNNFGIVARFTVRCFAATQLWSGFLYAPGWESTKALVALHESVKRADPRVNPVDLCAAGPIACFIYVQTLSMQVVTVHLAYTQSSQETEDKKGWPVYWKTSGFASLWRYWSTFKLQTVSSATVEMNSTSPGGQRWSFGTTTIKNDLETMVAARRAHQDAISSLKHIKGLIWTIVMQPLLPSWVAKGDGEGSLSPLGICESTDDPLLLLNFSVYWQRESDDELVYTTIRATLDKIERIAAANGTGHPYRYLNYCAQWQRPFEGYGEANRRWLRGVRQQYDPEGLFQRGCPGGFKLE